jgi:hypothetical protein
MYRCVCCVQGSGVALRWRREGEVQVSGRGWGERSGMEASRRAWRWRYVDAHGHPGSRYRTTVGQYVSGGGPDGVIGAGLKGQIEC